MCDYRNYREFLPFRQAKCYHTARTSEDIPVKPLHEVYFFHEPDSSHTQIRHMARAYLPHLHQKKFIEMARLQVRKNT